MMHSRCRLMTLGSWIFLFILIMTPLAALSNTIYIQHASMAVIRPPAKPENTPKLELMDVENTIPSFYGNSWKSGEMLQIKRFINDWTEGKLNSHKAMNVTLVGHLLTKREAHQPASYNFRITNPKYSSVFNNLTYDIKQSPVKMNDSKIHIKNPTLLIFH